MISNLYDVEYPLYPKFAIAAPIGHCDYDFDRIECCPQCGRYVSGGYWMHPRKVVLTSHKTPDFLYAYCDNVPFLLSENALNKIQQAGLIGIKKAEKIETVSFQRKSKREIIPPDYYHIELVRSRVTLDHEKSKIQYGTIPDEIPACSLCRQVATTYDCFDYASFNMEEYEGYDIFHIYELCNAVFLSQRFIDFCAKEKLTGLHYVPAEECGPRRVVPNW